jgi:hypothetical protein
MRAIDALHAWTVRQPVLRVFTLVVRALLAAAFVPSGLVKILDQPLTLLAASLGVAALVTAYRRAARDIGTRYDAEVIGRRP